MQPVRKIIHIDMDAFFASIEQLDQPELRGKPVIVGGKPGGRGVVAACSYEARRYGIHSAMPAARAARLCPQAIFMPPRMDRYRQVSKSIMGLFTRHTALVEPLSLDEAYLDVTVNNLGERSATRLATRICKEVFQETGLTCSAGVSYNKFLAKMASDLKKPNGISTIAPDQAFDFLSRLPIGRFYGVGKATEERMRQLGITNGDDLRKWDEQRLVGQFGKVGQYLYRVVRGMDDRPVCPSRERKSIGRETTLAHDSADPAEIEALLVTIAYMVGESLYKRRTGGYTLTLKVRYHDFSTITRSISSEYRLETGEQLVDLLPALLQKTMIGSLPVRLLGLSVSRLSDLKRWRQLPLPFTKAIGGGTEAGTLTF